MLSKLLSAIIAIAYVGIAFFAGGSEAAVKCGIFLTLPLACIWFSEEMGSYTGVMRGQQMTSTSPGCVVAFMGWLLLLLPIIMGVIQASSGSK